MAKETKALAEKGAGTAEAALAEAGKMALAPRSTDGFTGLRKAAILCVALGDELASEVFKHLDEDEVQQVSREVASLQRVPSLVANEVVEEFQQLLIARTYIVSGGVDYAQRLLVKTYGAAVAERLLERITRSLESTAGFDALQKVDPQQLSKLFQNEHPQTIALVLAHLEASTAAATLQYLPEAQRSDVVLRMASLQAISQDVIRRVSIVLDQKLKSVVEYNRQAVGGVRFVADLFNRLDRDMVRRMLDEMENSNPDIALEIRNRMVTFEDLLLVDDIGIREILQRVDKKALALALKGTVPELQQRFFSNMASRAVEMMKEEMDFMGQVKLKDVQNAQREIVEILRELDEKGVINLSGGGGGEDAYVS